MSKLSPFAPPFVLRSSIIGQPVNNRIQSTSTAEPAESSNKAPKKPKSNTPVEVSLQHLLVETALSRISIKDPPSQQQSSKGRPPNKKIIRPSDGKSKPTRVKKSVLNYQEKTAEGQPTTDIEGASIPALESLKEEIAGRNLYKAEGLATVLIAGLKRFQDTAHSKDEIKAKMRQRMFYGLKESLKYMHGNRVKMIILARDLESGPGGLNELVQEVIDKAKIYRVPVLCVLTRNKLRRLTHKPSRVSCIAITDPSGKDEEFNELLGMIQTKGLLQDTKNCEPLKFSRRGPFQFAVDKLY